MYSQQAMDLIIASAVLYTHDNNGAMIHVVNATYYLHV